MVRKPRIQFMKWTFGPKHKGSGAFWMVDKSRKNPLGRKTLIINLEKMKYQDYYDAERGIKPRKLKIRRKK